MQCNIKQHLERVFEYLNFHKSFLNCHMVNYLTEDFWNKYIPNEIKSEIASNGESHIDNAIQIFWRQNDINCTSNEYPEFRKFLKTASDLHLDKLQDVSVCQNIEMLNENLKRLNCHITDKSLKLTEFMSAKKNHEVEITARTIANLCTYNSATSDSLIVIDAGDGKGYLSSRLALEHNLYVLGIDANSLNTKNAERRNLKLERAWNGLTNRAETIQSGNVPERRGHKNKKKNRNVQQSTEPGRNLYRTTTAHIDSETDLTSLIGTSFPEIENKDLNFCLTGLHACGNLTSNCLRIFLQQPKITSLCVVGCCYHLITEEFAVPEFFPNQSPDSDPDATPGFPMSDFLRQKNISIGRNARMLAAQSIHRVIAEKELPNQTLYYRSLLELLKQKDGIKDVFKAGRINKCENFVQYIAKVSEKEKVNFGTYSTHDLEEIEMKYEYNRKLLNLFYLIRLTFAPVLETLIILDRYLYLKENHVENIFLVKLFDPVVSPRCYGIIALK